MGIDCDAGGDKLSRIVDACYDLTAMARIASLSIRALLILAIIATAARCGSALFRWGNEAAGVWPWVTLCLAITAGATASACSAVILVRRRNALRVTVVLATTLVGAWVGAFILSDLLTWGSYDHEGGGETVRNALIWGPVGAIIGCWIGSKIRFRRIVSHTQSNSD